jgi:hypothetical protein
LAKLSIHSHRISDFAGERIGTPLLFFDELYYFTPSYWQERAILKDFNELFDGIVAKLKAQSAKRFEEDPNSHKKFGDFLLDEKNAFPLDEITDHVKAIVYGVRRDSHSHTFTPISITHRAMTPQHQQLLPRL